MEESRGNQYPSILEAEQVAREYENAGKVQVQNDEPNINVIESDENEKFAKLEIELFHKLEKTFEEKLKKRLDENYEKQFEVKQSEICDQDIQKFTEIKIDDEINNKESEEKTEKNDAENSILKNEKTKITWGRPSEFVLLVSLSLFSLNMPYVVYRHGGIIYFIPMVVTFFLVGMPLFSLNTLLAQYSGHSIVSLFDFCPLFKGIGYALVFTEILFGISQNFLFSWALYYISLIYKSPWFGCHHYFNTETCLEQLTYNECSSENSYQGYCSLERQKSLDVSEFLRNEVLQLTTDLGFGSFHIRLFLCLTVGSLITFLCLFRGIKILGKFAYIIFSAIFLFLLILFIRGITLPGGESGLSYLLLSDFYWLIDFNIWVQCCKLWLPFCGAVIVYSSHNKFNTNFFKQYTIIGGIHLLFVFLSCATIMCFVGHLSYNSGIPVQDVIDSGYKLIFEVILKALQTTPLSSLWIALFLFLVFFITLGQLLPGVLALSDALTEILPRHLEKKNVIAVGCVCLFYILLGILFAFGNGLYIFTMIDFSLTGLFLTAPIFFECLASLLFYGTKRLSANVEDMLAMKLSIWFKVLWAALIPAVLVLLTLISLPEIHYISIEGYYFPMVASIVSYIIYAIPSIIILICAFVAFFRANGSFIERFRTITKPKEEWDMKKKLNTLPVQKNK